MNSLPKNVIAIRRFFEWIQMHPFAFLSAVLALFALISLCFVPYQVDIGSVGVVRRFGNYVGEIAGPGLHFKWPWKIDQVDIVYVETVRRLELQAKPANQPGSLAREYFSGDQNLIDVRCTLQYQIIDAAKFLFYAKEPVEIMAAQANEIILSEIATQGTDDILTREKNEIQNAILIQLDSVLKPSNLGIKLLSVNLDEIMPPYESREAYQDVINAREERFRDHELAQSYKIEVVGKAQGMAKKTVDLAHADAYSRVQLADAAAARFNVLLARNKVAPRQTAITAYYNMVDQLLPKASTFILRPKQGAFIEFNLLDHIWPSANEHKKEQHQKTKKKGMMEDITNVLLPPSYFEKISDRTAGAGGHEEAGSQGMHSELPTSIPMMAGENE